LISSYWLHCMASDLYHTHTRCIYKRSIGLQTIMEWDNLICSHHLYNMQLLCVNLLPQISSKISILSWCDSIITSDVRTMSAIFWIFYQSSADCWKSQSWTDHFFKMQFYPVWATRGRRENTCHCFVAWKTGNCMPNAVNYLFHLHHHHHICYHLTFSSSPPLGRDIFKLDRCAPPGVTEAD